MIVSYRDKRTERFASGHHVKEFSGFARQAVMRLDRLDAAMNLPDLAALPGNRLEALKGDRAGQFSIASTINGGFALPGRANHPVPLK